MYKLVDVSTEEVLAVGDQSLVINMMIQEGMDNVYATLVVIDENEKVIASWG